MVLALATAIAKCENPGRILQEFDADRMIHHGRLKDIGKISDYVIYLEQGDRIPVKMTLESEILDMADPDNRH